MTDAELQAMIYNDPRRTFEYIRELQAMLPKVDWDVYQRLRQHQRELANRDELNADTATNRKE